MFRPSQFVLFQQLVVIISSQWLFGVMGLLPSMDCHGHAMAWAAAWILLFGIVFPLSLYTALKYPRITSSSVLATMFTLIVLSTNVVDAKVYWRSVPSECRERSFRVVAFTSVAVILISLVQVSMVLLVLMDFGFPPSSVLFAAGLL